jgi:hypothetical protein
MEEMDRINNFWRWFIVNQSRFLAIDTPSNPLVRLIGAKLREINKDLHFEVCADRRPCEFIISASGKQALFKLVRLVIDQAPHIDDWKFIALKPPSGFKFTTSYKGVNINPKETWFLPLKKKGDSKFLGFRIAVSPEIDPKAPETRVAVFIVLDTGLGEQVVAEVVNYIEIENVPKDPEKLGYGRLEKLPQYIKNIVTNAGEMPTRQ